MLPVLSIASTVQLGNVGSEPMGASPMSNAKDVIGRSNLIKNPLAMATVSPAVEKKLGARIVIGGVPVPSGRK